MLGESNTAWNGNVLFCTFAAVNFLAESAPESRLLHLKLQNFSGITPLDWIPTVEGGDPHLTPTPNTAVLAVHGGNRPVQGHKLLCCGMSCLLTA